MKKEYDVVDETLLPTLAPAIQAFGLPQQIVNKIVTERHKQAGIVGLSAGLSLGGLAASGLASLLKVAPKARDAAVSASATGSAVFGRALRDSAPGVSKLIGKSDVDTATALKEFANVAADADHMAKLLRTPSARGAMPTAVIDHLLASNTEREALFNAARSANIVDSNADLFASVARDAVDGSKQLTDTHPVSIAGAMLGAGSLAVGTYDMFRPPPREPDPWYRSQAAAAAGAGALGAALGASGLYAASTYGGRPSVLGTQEPPVKLAGLVATGLGILGTATGALNQSGSTARFAENAMNMFPSMSPEQLQQVADAYVDSTKNSTMGRATRGLGAATAIASGAGAVHNYQLKEDNARQRKEFDRKMPALIAGATGAGVVLGGVGGRLADSAVTRAVSKGREISSRPITV